MSLAQAFEKATAKKGKKIDIPKQAKLGKTDPGQVPMMYRAQVSGRCSLMFAGDNNHLNRWTEEWIYPREDKQPHYQHKQPQLGLDNAVYRLEITFPFRLCSNCGQDSIFRPVIGKNGIPLIPGSSVKGVFRQLANSQEVSLETRNKVREYCGSEEHPGILRFHGAYPVGDWAGTKGVSFYRDGNSVTETRYRLVDIVHPQQPRQVQGTGSPKAIAMISFYRPKIIFELSSTQQLSEDEWDTIKGLLRRALRQGLGGKTSTGYGLWVIPRNRYTLYVDLKGIGVSPLLRSDEPEFRPNLFKATLRGHVSRLLAGVCNNKNVVEARVNQLFGYTKAPGSVQIYWESRSFDDGFQGTENTPIYKTEGTLHIDDLHNDNDIKLLELVLQFAYTMGGFGKSWRRVWHKGFNNDEWHPGFYPSYKTRAIGCHWKWEFSSFDPIAITNSEELKEFLNTLCDHCRNYMSSEQSQYYPWKESWHPKRIAVYSKVVSQSAIIGLFHDNTFKTTPAIGGRNPNDDCPTAVSSVWHRMLPIDDNQYLEIVTLFHGIYAEDRVSSQEERWRDDWRHQERGDQLLRFIGQLKSQKLKLTWGTEPTSQTTPSRSPQGPRR